MSPQDQNPPKASPVTPLGAVPLPSGTFEHDLSIQARYEGFSTELVRLSLLGLSALGYVLYQSDSDIVCTKSTAPVLLFTALASFLLSTSAALWHRYASTDALSEQLEALRRSERGDKKDDTSAKEAIIRRDKNFQHCRTALLVSSTALIFGACTFCLMLFV